MKSVDIGFPAPNWTSMVLKMDSASKTTPGTEFLGYLENIEFCDHVYLGRNFGWLTKSASKMKGTNGSAVSCLTRNHIIFIIFEKYVTKRNKKPTFGHF